MARGRIPALEALPDDLVAALCRPEGVEATRKAFSACSRLHKAWQRAVRSLRVGGVEERDLSLLAKYSGLRSLSIDGDTDYSGYTKALPAWHVVGALASKLPKLEALHVSELDAFHVLHAIIPAESLRARLTRLDLADEHHSMVTGELRALGSLPSLRSLALRCNYIWAQVRNAHLQLGSQLSSLRELTLGMSSLECTTGDALSALPGSLTSLTSLSLSNYGGNVAEQTKQQMFVVTAASCLTNLQSFATNFMVVDATAQLELLSGMHQLTRLELQCHPPELPHLAALPQLPSLQHLSAPCYFIPGGHAFLHPSLTFLEIGGASGAELCVRTFRGRAGEPVVRLFATSIVSAA